MGRLTLTMASILVLAGCESPKPSGKVIGAGQAAARNGGPTELRLAVPTLEQFDSLDDVVEKNLQEMAIKLVASDSACRKYEQEKVRSFSEGKTLSYDVDPTCDWEVTVALGATTEEEDDEVRFQAHYQAKERVYRERLQEKSTYDLELEYERTAAGGTAGFRADAIVVSPEGSFDDDEVERDDERDEKEDEDDRQDDEQGASLTYERDVKPILEASCTSCHSPRGSRPTSDLTSFAAVSRWKDQVASLVASGNMPPGAPLSSDKKKVIDDWKKGGFKQ